MNGSIPTMEDATSEILRRLPKVTSISIAACGIGAKEWYEVNFVLRDGSSELDTGVTTETINAILAAWFPKASVYIWCKRSDDAPRVQLPTDDVSDASRIRLEAEVKKLRAENEQLRATKDDEHKQLIAEKAFTAKARPALDALARFTANLNLQDHPVAEQRKAAAVVRQGMEVLQPHRYELIATAMFDKVRYLAKFYIGDK
jgi:hypothetical protein